MRRSDGPGVDGSVLPGSFGNPIVQHILYLYIMVSAVRLEFLSNYPTTDHLCTIRVRAIMSITSVLAAAALVAAFQHPLYWELVEASIIIRVVHGETTGYMHICVPGQQQSVRDLYQAVEDAVNTQSPENDPNLTIFVVQNLPRDLESYANDVVLASGFAVQTSIVVALDYDRRVHIAHSNFSVDSKTWYAHRVDSTLTWLCTKASLNTTLHSTPIISILERKHLLNWGTAPSSSLSTEHTYSPMIHHYFERAARLTPNAVAIQWEDKTFVTYSGLDQKCNALAAHLVQAFGVVRGDIVLQFFDRGIEMIVALLAVVCGISIHVITPWSNCIVVAQDRCCIRSSGY